jgi:hypothetical protein
MLDVILKAGATPALFCVLPSTLYTLHFIHDTLRSAHYTAGLAIVKKVIDGKKGESTQPRFPFPLA